MVIHLVRIDVPTARAEEFAKWQAPHVVEAVAAMGRSAIAARARVQSSDDPAQFRWFFELGGLSTLESYLISRERDDLDQEFRAAFPEAKVRLEFGELEGNTKRGLRYGEDPGAAYTVEVEIPAAERDAWLEWYDTEHIPAVLDSGAFVRARRFEMHQDAADRSSQLVVFDAVDLKAAESYVAEKGRRLAEAHRERFPNAKASRSIWEWLG